MHKRLRIGIIAGLITTGLFLVGCVAGKTYTVTPVKKSTPLNAYFDATITPTSANVFGYQAFILDIKNKSDKDIEVNWNKTYFIQNGQTNGTFMYEGIVYRDRNQPKSSDIIFANATFSKTIWPSNLVYYSSGSYGGWMHEAMSAGIVGVYLTANVDGKEIKEKIEVAMREVQK